MAAHSWHLPPETAFAEYCSPERLAELEQRAAGLKTPEECERFATNVEERGFAGAASAARMKWAKLRAAAHRQTDPVEREALEALYAHEFVLSGFRSNARRVLHARAEINCFGALPTVERMLGKGPKPALDAYRKLVNAGMQEMAPEAVVLRHPEAFNPRIVANARRTLSAYAKQRSPDERVEQQ